MGVIMGTAAYMAPEQAKGRPVDKRADVWAFGAVLFEMLTGRKPFVGEDVSDTLALVLKFEPEWAALPATLSPVLTTYLHRCLQKDPRQRVRDIGDVRLALEGAFETTATPSGRTPLVPVVQPAWRRLLPAATAAVFGGLCVGVAAWFVIQTDPARPVRFDHRLPEGLTFANTGRPMIDLSSDGHALVYISPDGLYLRELDELSARLIPGTAAVTNPFFSPDGQTLGYWDRNSGELKGVSTGGGAPVTITEAENPFGVTWAVNGTILYGQRDGVWQVADTGGTSELVVPIEVGELVHGPRLLPDGEWVLFTLKPAGAAWNEAAVLAQSLTTGERVPLIEGGRDGRYVDSGHLVYGRDGVVLAVPFDPALRRVLGGPVSLIDSVGQALVDSGAMHFALADNGTAAYIPGVVESRTSLIWVDRDGRGEVLPFPADAYLSVSLSPNGRQAGVGIDNADNQDVYVADVDRGTLTRVTFHPADDRHPIWSPDGQSLVFTSTRGGRVGLFRGSIRVSQ